MDIFFVFVMDLSRTQLTKDLLKKHCKEDAAAHLNLVTKALNAERADKDFHREASQCNLSFLF